MHPSSMDASIDGCSERSIEACLPLPPSCQPCAARVLGPTALPLIEHCRPALAATALVCIVDDEVWRPPELQSAASWPAHTLRRRPQHGPIGPAIPRAAASYHRSQLRIPTDRACAPAALDSSFGHKFASSYHAARPPVRGPPGSGGHCQCTEVRQPRRVCQGERV